MHRKATRVLESTFLILLIGLFRPGYAQTRDSIVLENRFLSRTFTVDGNGFYTSGFKNRQTGHDYSRAGSAEFYFTLDGHAVSGAGERAAFSYVRKSLEKSADGVQKLSVFLEGKAGGPAAGLAVELVYWLYDELPVVRKQLIITNQGAGAVSIANLDMERLNLEPITQQQTDIYSEYGTHLTWRPYRGNYYDPAVFVYHTYEKEGFILGNEAPSVLKHTAVYARNNQVSIGMTRLDQPFPFKKWIAPGEKFCSPRSFICLVKAATWQDAFEGYFADFIRTRLGVHLFSRKEIPFTLYNTWRPFYTKISDTLVRRIADGLEGTGTDILIMDDGWQNNHGDWEADPVKFPHGLKPVCDYIIQKGMRPGLWLSLATVAENSQVYQAHPEWAVGDAEGHPTYLHVTGDPHHFTMSLGSGYYDYILKKIVHLVKENRLAYIKLDFAIINSAYVLDDSKKGDYGPYAGKTYRDRASSFYGVYERALQLFDDIHKACPELLIDCTYEVWGEYYINDFALIEHADYDWLTNYNEDPPEGPINIRQMSYDRARVIPPATNLIGNQLMNTPYARYTFLSLASSKPILVGDPRGLPDSLKQWYAGWNKWFKMMDRKYQFTRFNQTSDIFPRANMQNWDGCYKFNKAAGGGVLFFYRNGSLESTRTFPMPLADSATRYRVYAPQEQRTLGIFTGRELREKGLTITIAKPYEAEVLGIEKLRDDNQPGDTRTTKSRK